MHPKHVARKLEFFQDTRQGVFGILAFTTTVTRSEMLFGDASDNVQR